MPVSLKGFGRGQRLSFLSAAPSQISQRWGNGCDGEVCLSTPVHTVFSINTHDNQENTHTHTHTHTQTHTHDSACTHTHTTVNLVFSIHTNDSQEIQIPTHTLSLFSAHAQTHCPALATGPSTRSTVSMNSMNTNKRFFNSSSSSASTSSIAIA